MMVSTLISGVVKIKWFSPYSERFHRYARNNAIDYGFLDKTISLYLYKCDNK